jgi:hypothetical protein
MFYAFEAEVSRLMGRYTLSRAEISREAADSHDIVVHEGIHERIIHDTMDGTLHAMIHHGGTSLGAERSRTYSARLLTESKFAHEAAATYLGVQSLDVAEERASARRKMPAAYRAYYQALDEPISKLTPSTYLSFMLGWTLGYWAFSSSRLAWIFERGWGDLEDALLLPSPDQRLRGGLELLTPERALAWKSEAVDHALKGLHDLGIDAWDFDEDRAWNERPREQQAQFEYLFGEKLGNWLTDELPFESSYSLYMPEGFGDWMIDFFVKNGVDLTVSRRDRAFEFDANRRLDRTKAQLDRVGRSVFFNPSPAVLPYVDTSTNDGVATFAKRLMAGTPAFVGPPASGKERRWAVYVIADESGTDGVDAQVDKFLVDYSFAWKVAADIGARASAKGLIECALITGANPATIGSLVQILGVAAGLDRQNPNFLTALSAKFESTFPLWYWPDWPSIYDFNNVRSTLATLEVSGTPYAETYTAHVASTSDFPGYFLCLKPRLVGHKILEFEAAAVAEGKIEEMPDDEASRVIRAAKWHIGGLLDRWPEY